MAVLLLTAIFLSLFCGPLALAEPLTFAVAQRNVQPHCTARFIRSILPNSVTLVRLDALKANSTYGDDPAGNPAFPRHPTGLPALCALTLEVISSSKTNATHRVGMFLPLPSAWKARTILIGTGSFTGGINWLFLGPGTHMGFVTATSDTGHISTGGDSSWALNDPEKQADWGWRAMYSTVGVTRAVVKGYYGRDAKYRYYNGCSNAARQGMKVVQIDPTSFDGVLLGAPVWWANRANNWMTKAGLDNLPVNDPKRIDVSRFPTLAKEVVRQCDGVDGVLDGIISRPDACTFDYEQIRCGGPGPLNTSECFTEAQIGVIRSVRADWVDPDNNNAFLHPGMTLGSEDDWYILLGGTEPTPLGTGYQRNFLYNDPNWTWENGNFGPKTVYYAQEVDPGNATADNFDLHEFRDRGGKMVLYQGLADALVIPKGSEYYYNRVIETTGGGDLNATRDFFRYFKVPGMNHCRYTPASVQAPWAFGAPAQADAWGDGTWSVPGFEDEQHDILQALVKWVEEDRPLDSVIATTWENQQDPTSPVLRQRPLCAVPYEAVYDGVGDVNAASSWSCKIV